MESVEASCKHAHWVLRAPQAASHRSFREVLQQEVQGSCPDCTGCAWRRLCAATAIHPCPFVGTTSGPISDAWPLIVPRWSTDILLKSEFMLTGRVLTNGLRAVGWETMSLINILIVAMVKPADLVAMIAIYPCCFSFSFVLVAIKFEWSDRVEDTDWRMDIITGPQDLTGLDWSWPVRWSSGNRLSYTQKWWQKKLPWHHTNTRIHQRITNNPKKKHAASTAIFIWCYEYYDKTYLHFDFLFSFLFSWLLIGKH